MSRTIGDRSNTEYRTGLSTAITPMASPRIDPLSTTWSGTSKATSPRPSSAPSQRAFESAAKPVPVNVRVRSSLPAAAGACGLGSSRSTSTPEMRFECDDKDTAWKAYVGGQFNRIVGMEIGYTDFGRINAGTLRTAWEGEPSGD